jgi:hypothetical protein
VVCGVITLVGYAVIATALGPHSGLGDMSGWYLYARTAPFADCERMTIDDEVEEMSALCEETPPDDRWGPYHYQWSPDGPARSRWHTERGPDPAYDGTLARFALDAIRAQPADYLAAVGHDLVRVVFPSYRPRPGSGQLMAAYAFDWRDEPTRKHIEQALSSKYTEARVTRRSTGVRLLAEYQRATRVPGTFVIVFLACAAIGFARLRAVRRRPLVLAVLVGLSLLLSPIITFTWDFRYTLPAIPVLALAAVLAFGSEPAAESENTRPSS